VHGISQGIIGKIKQGIRLGKELFKGYVRECEGNQAV
jgi:hypothetical protein